MPTISQIVAQIRTAIFGKDVRENIALGIETCHNEISSATAESNTLANRLAKPFSDQDPYKIGEYVIYNSNIWQFIADHEAGAWDASEVINPIMGDELFDITEMTRAIKFTPQLNFTNGGLTWESTEDPDVVKVYGTCTGTRRIIIFNNYMSAKATSTGFSKILDPGVYYIESDVTGFQPLYNISGSYSTYASSSFTIVSNTTKNKIYKFTAPAMIGITVQSGRNYGTEEEPTYLKIKVLKKTANDIYSRSEIQLHDRAINNMNKNRIAFGNIKEAGTANSFHIKQDYEYVTVNGASTASSSQGNSKVLLSGPLFIKNDTSVTDQEKTYPITLVKDRIYAITVRYVSGTRTNNSGTGNTFLRLYDEDNNIVGEAKLTMDDEIATGIVKGQGQRVNVYLCVPRLMTCEDLVLETYLEDVTDSASIERVYNNLNDITGNSPIINFIPDKYINVTTDPIDITNPADSTVGCGYAIVDVNPGECYTINSDGASSRAFAVIDSEGHPINIGSSSTAYYDYLIKIPEGGSKLIINAKPSNGDSYYGEMIVKRLNDHIENSEILKHLSLPVLKENEYMKNASNWTIGSGVKIDTGRAHFSDPEYCRTGNVPLDYTTLICLDDDRYEYIVWEYTNNSVAYATYSPSGKKYSQNPVIVSNLHGGKYYKLSVRRVDRADITSEDIEILTNAVKTYISIDDSNKYIIDYSTVVSGSSEQLLSKSYKMDKDTPYTFRLSCGGIGVGDRMSDKLIGGSLDWNQYVENGNFADDTKWSSFVLSSKTIANNVCTMVPGAGSSNRIYATIPTIPAGHVVLVKVDFMCSSEQKISFRFGVANGTAIRSGVNSRLVTATEITTGVWETYYGIFVHTNDEKYVNFGSLSTVNAGDNYEWNIRNFQVFDLTQMFGTEIANYVYSLDGTGTVGEWFEKLFPMTYYSFTRGKLMGVNVKSHKMIGFNIWDGVWEAGGISLDTGKNANAQHVRTINYIPVFPNTEYYFNNGGTSIGWSLRYYDINKNYIGPKSVTYIPGKFTTPNNCYYMRFIRVESTYSGGTCISLFDAATNGRYEDYEMHEYPIGNVELHGIPKLDENNNLYFDGDTYESNGKVTRKYGVVDLGTLNWTKIESTTIDVGYAFKATINNYDAYNNYGNRWCLKYKDVSGNGLSSIVELNGSNINKTIFNDNGATNPYLYIIDSEYTEATDFISAMDGVLFIYPLVNEVIETSDTFQDPQVVDTYGTEEYVDRRVAEGTSDVSIPVNHETKYYYNLREKLESAPDAPSDGDGDYMLRVTNGQSSYVKIPSATGVNF